MRSKKIITIIIFLVAIGIGLSIFCCVRNKKKNVNGETLVKHEACDFTRYEWIKLLCEKVGVTDYQNKTPYFDDVAADNEYFNYIQAAVEWEVIEDGEKFYGDYCVSGEFVAMTTMKSISKEKMEIYLESDEEVTDKKYLEVAEEVGLVSKEDLDKCYALIEAQMVLEKLDGLIFGTFWKEDYEKIEFAENVTEIFPEEIISINEDCSEIKVSEVLLDELEEGQTVIFDYGNTGLKCARKITQINTDGTLVMGDDVAMEDAFETLVVSDVNELTFEDIANYYGVTVNEGEGFEATKVFDKEIKSKGFKINLEIDDKNELSVKITDNASGCWFKIPLIIILKEDVECDIEIDVDEINVGAQVNYKVLGGLKSADVAIESHANVSGGILGFDEEKKIALYETVTPIGNGYVGVDIGVYLVLTAEGSIRFEVEMPMEASINYQKGKGIKDHSFDIDVENPVIEGDCTAGVSVQFEPTLVILMVINVVDVQTDVGIGAHANVKNRPGDQTCTDISVYYPTFSISICGDDEADTLLGAFGVSAGWEIIDEDNAPFKMNLHHEILKNGKMQFVYECTYEEGSEDAEIETEGEIETETGALENPDIQIDANLIDLSEAYGEKYMVSIGAEPFYYLEEVTEFGHPIGINVIETEEGYMIQGDVFFYDYITEFPIGLSKGDEIVSKSGNKYEVDRIMNEGMYYILKGGLWGDATVENSNLLQRATTLVIVEGTEVSGVYMLGHAKIIEDVCVIIPYNTIMEESLRNNIIDKFYMYDKTGNISLWLR